MRRQSEEVLVCFITFLRVGRELEACRSEHIILKSKLILEQDGNTMWTLVDSLTFGRPPLRILQIGFW